MVMCGSGEAGFRFRDFFQQRARVPGGARWLSIRHRADARALQRIERAGRGQLRHFVFAKLRNAPRQIVDIGKGRCLALG